MILNCRATTFFLYFKPRSRNRSERSPRSSLWSPRMWPPTWEILPWILPSGNLTQLWKDSPFFMGKLTISMESMDFPMAEDRMLKWWEEAIKKRSILVLFHPFEVHSIPRISSKMIPAKSLNTVHLSGTLWMQGLWIMGTSNPKRKEWNDPKYRPQAQRLQHVTVKLWQMAPWLVWSHLSMTWRCCLRICSASVSQGCGESFAGNHDGIHGSYPLVIWHHYGKSPFLGKLTISMVLFNSHRSC